MARPLQCRPAVSHLQRTRLRACRRFLLNPGSRPERFGAARAGDLITVKQRLIPVLEAVALSGAFTEPIVREMARKTDRPVILPLSNPTANSEAAAEDLIRWTDGRALVAAGSPYAPVKYDGRSIPIAQCNKATQWTPTYPSLARSKR
jgi:malate dehydrogenase (oxaloacetate-decarboxylating)